MTSKLHMVDYDSIHLDETCGMKRWFTEFEAGMGIRRREAVVTDAIEQQTRNDLRTISEAEDISPATLQLIVAEILAKLTPEDREDTERMELLYRRLGWMVGFALYIEPALRKHFDNIPVDDEILLERGELALIVHPDRVLRDKSFDRTIYREFIIMNRSVDRKGWLSQWQHQMRIHAGMAAAEQQLKMKMDFGQVMGISSGYRSAIDGRLFHPYIYGYQNQVTKEWSTGGYKSSEDNWKCKPVWEFDGGVVAWVQMCGAEIANAVFPISPIIEMDAYNLEKWLKVKLIREKAVDAIRPVSHTNQNLREIHFEKRFSACRPMQSEPCPFLNACWNKDLTQHPLKSGEFVVSTPARIDIEIGAAG